jgi:hypothetical protein
MIPIDIWDHGIYKSSCFPLLLIDSFQTGKIIYYDPYFANDTLKFVFLLKRISTRGLEMLL